MHILSFRRTGSLEERERKKILHLRPFRSRGWKIYPFARIFPQLEIADIFFRFERLAGIVVGKAWMRSNEGCSNSIHPPPKSSRLPLSLSLFPHEISKQGNIELVHLRKLLSRSLDEIEETKANRFPRYLRKGSSRSSARFVEIHGNELDSPRLLSRSWSPHGFP